ncbi:alpha-1,3-galactosidase-related protein [Niabella hirudinis]|uniref:alpha-1,3-galactosidase-related protein n=1 Tax=Niabella hirudinis TaxID=1285929 RepID=UPI003EBEECAC
MKHSMAVPRPFTPHHLYLLRITLGLFFVLLSQVSGASNDTSYYHLASMGIKPNTGLDVTAALNRLIVKIKTERRPGRPVAIIFEPGRYDFFPEKAIRKPLYISNHDQTNPKTIGLLFENMDHLLINGNGADWMFHGRMLPLAVENCRRFSVKNVHIDFDKPQICQVEIISNDTINKAITFKTAPWVQYEIRDSVFYNKGEDWELNPTSGIAFEKNTRHIVYNTGDLRVPLRNVAEISPGVVKAGGWDNKKLLPGVILAMRSWQRPAPGIFLDQCKDVAFENVAVHYAEGMGLLAQVSENITLDHFNVALRGTEDLRYFTTQADATHFSGCKGEIKSVGGLYEGMMDDAINIHGTYLKVIGRKGPNTLIAQYMHSQSYGFKWGDPGDQVQFIASKTMEVTGEKNSIRSIAAVDKPGFFGAKQFEIVFTQQLDAAVLNEEQLGIENLTWTPEVYFAHNTIRNNRARGALFSTPKKTVIEHNFFDHTSGSAILLCGDCNGWFETGACRSVLIRNNRFVNSLTNMFQFTNAIISIYPEIPELSRQRKYFHSGIRIENNVFETFDKPLVYAKSVDGLVFRNNKIKTNREYPGFHWNRYPFLFERVINYKFLRNHFDGSFDREKDVKVKNL